MSAEESRKVVSRAVMDEEFRNTLFSDPDKALVGYDLTPEEITALRSIPAETIDDFANNLDERISMSILATGFQAMGSDTYGGEVFSGDVEGAFAQGDMAEGADTEGSLYEGANARGDMAEGGVTLGGKTEGGVVLGGKTEGGVVLGGETEGDVVASGEAEGGEAIGAAGAAAGAAAARTTWYGRLAKALGISVSGGSAGPKSVR